MAGSNHDGKEVTLTMSLEESQRLCAFLSKHSKFEPPYKVDELSPESEAFANEVMELLTLDFETIAENLK